MDVTIFEQDGIVYAAISHRAPSDVRAIATAQEIRDMEKIPRSKMRVVTIDEFKTMPFDAPKRS